MAALAAIARQLAPSGRLRAAINLSNPVLYRAQADGQPGGVALDIARELAAQLEIALHAVPLESARLCVQAVQDGAADVGFFAIDPARGDSLHFTPPYLVMEGVYVVRADSAIARNEDVDRPGHRVAAGAGSAYAMHLARALRHARVVDVARSPRVVETFLAQGLEVAAGVRHQMLADVAQRPGLRLLGGRFMAIHQAMAAARSCPPAVLDRLDAFVEDLKQWGFIAHALARHGVEGAEVAPFGHPAD